jgi:hypothetical protein
MSVRDEAEQGAQRNQAYNVLLGARLFPLSYFVPRLSLFV